MTATTKTRKSIAKKKTKVNSRASAKRTVKKKPVAKTLKKKTKTKPAAAKKTTSKKKTANQKAVSKPGTAKAKVGKKREPPLNLRRYRKELCAKQAELLQAYLNAKGDSRARESDGTEDYIDYAVSSYDREFLLSLTELEQSQLNLVEEALKRIDAGGFGLCALCDKSIPVKRLDVQPWARCCLRCQELVDEGLIDDDDSSDDEETDVAADDGDGEESEDTEEIEGTVGGRSLDR